MFRWKNSSQTEQENKEAALKEAKIKELKTLLGQLSGRDSLYCSDACLKRYLEARNWNVSKAKKMLEETLKWRSTFKPGEIRWDEISIESETGKVYKAGFHDRNGRTVLILRPGLQNTKSIENQMKHLVYLIENAILNLPEDQEQMSWLIDFTNWSMSTSVPIKYARETINILQNHYPERLAVAFLYNPPRIFEAFWKIVKYFIDAKTFDKVKFVYPKNPEKVELMSSYFDKENLPTEFGGKASLQYIRLHIQQWFVLGLLCVLTGTTGAVQLAPRQVVSGMPALRPVMPPMVRPPSVPFVSPAEKPQTTIYIGKIATVENDFMMYILEFCGHVKSCLLAEDPTTKKPKGFGFYEFESAEGILRAIRLLTKRIIDGQELLVNVNQATKEYLLKYVEKKIENAKQAKESQAIGAGDKQAEGPESEHLVITRGSGNHTINTPP